MNSKATAITLTLFSLAFALAFATSADAHVMPVASGIKLNSGNYHSLNKAYFLTNFVVQDGAGTIHLYEGVDAVEGAGTPAIYSPSKIPNEYVTDSQVTIDSNTVASCTPTTEVLEPCDSSLYDDSGALLFKTGDVFERKQMFTVLDPTTFVLNPIVYTYYRNNVVIIEKKGAWDALTFTIGAAPPLNGSGT